MPEYTYEQLKHMNVTDLREIAESLGDHEALHGFSGMHKEHLVPKICQVMGIEDHEHHEVVGINKKQIKDKIKDLKVERDKALDVHDHKKLKEIRRRIHRLKRKMHKATV